MADIIDVSDQQEQPVASAKKISLQVGITFKTAFWLSVAFCAIGVTLFFWGQCSTLSLNAPIDNGVFGTFGDFVGGFLGTIISLYSVYMLVRTFQNQIETNADVVQTNHSVVDANSSAIETNKKLVSQTQLQIFDSRYTTILNLYRDALNSYTFGEIKGREAFETIVSEFQEKGLENGTEYKRRSIGAVSEYMHLYVINRQYFSVHFRMLYLLAKLTAEEKIHENYRASYAKSIRGQLSEGELLILRYNCLSPYGEKMRIYVNKFNLIKHLPITNLLEFTYWRRLIADEGCCSSIDQLYITLKKLITGMIDKDTASTKLYTISSRLQFDFDLNSNFDRLDIKFTMSKVKKTGGAIKRPMEEKAFDCIPFDQLKTFFQELFVEMFLYSNFFMFNGEDNHIVTTNLVNNSDRQIVVLTTVSRPGKRLALADRQVMPS